MDIKISKVRPFLVSQVGRRNDVFNSVSTQTSSNYFGMDSDNVISLFRSQVYLNFLSIKTLKIKGKLFYYQTYTKVLYKSLFPKLCFRIKNFNHKFQYFHLEFMLKCPIVDFFIKYFEFCLFNQLER